MNNLRKERRTFLFVIVCISLLFSMMPAMAFAETEIQASTIDEDINILGVKMPQYGDVLGTAIKTEDIQLDGSESYGWFDSLESQWLYQSPDDEYFEEDQATPLKDGEKFEDGAYILKVKINAKSGSEFKCDTEDYYEDEKGNIWYTYIGGASEGCISFNGQAAEEVADDYWTAVSSDKKTLIIYAGYGILKPCFEVVFDKDELSVSKDSTSIVSEKEYDMPKEAFDLKMKAKGDTEIYGVGIRDNTTEEWKYIKNKSADLTEFTVTVKDLDKNILIEPITYPHPFDNEFSVNYVEGKGADVKVDGQSFSSGTIESFEKDKEIQFELVLPEGVQKPYRVEIVDNLTGYAENIEGELIDDTKFSYTNTTDDGFDVRVYWTSADKLFDIDYVGLRYAGDNRYDTALKTADGTKSALAVDEFANVIVTRGDNFPDALSGGYLAYLTEAPILLVSRDNESQIVEYIEENMCGDGTVYILGSTAAVSSDFEKALDDDGYTCERLKGQDRYETNLNILKACAAMGGSDFSDILIATGDNYPDSLSASAVKKPILLVSGDSLNPSQVNFLNGYTGSNYYILGGNSAVSPAMESAVAAILKGSASTRIAGATRYETSVRIAEKFFSPNGEEIDSLVFAVATNYPDGLSGSSLAMAINAPIVLTSKDSYAEAKSFRTKVKAKRAAVLGGTGLISDEALWDIMHWGVQTAEIKEVK